MSFNLQKLRQGHGYTQEYLAKVIGVSRPTFLQAEKGERDLTVTEARKLAALFGMSLEEFLSGKEAPEPEVILEQRKAKKKQPDLKIEVPADKVRKFKEILLYILGKIGAQPNIGQTALYKILYFIDFDYYEEYGKKLIGATYIKNHYGPTPVEFKKVIEEMEKEKAIETVKSCYFEYQQKKYLPLRRPDLSVIDGREKEFIDEILNHFADKNARQMSEYSHADAPWRYAKSGSVIPYNLVHKREEDYFRAAQQMSWQDSEKHLDPLDEEEIEYYENLVKKNERKRNKMR